MYEAPSYKGSEKLKDMVAIITDGDSGIGRPVAVLFSREAADIAIVYLNEHEDAKATKQAVEKEGRRCILIAGDVGDTEFCTEAVRKTIDHFGRLDILVNNAAFQQHASDITAGHPDECCRAGPGVDTTQSRRPACREICLGPLGSRCC
jgi:NAD(P)-dependent dehydrogenase (short-subunit alcohol dehydrogenase family)